MAPTEKQSARRQVNKWAAGAITGTGILGARLMLGETLTATDARALGIIGGNLGHAARTLELAGWKIERADIGGNAKSFRVSKAPADAPAVTPPPAQPANTPNRSGGTRRNVRAEQAGETHPALGAKLTVRALALDERGRLVVHLSNGTGAAWQAMITGHVAG